MFDAYLLSSPLSSSIQGIQPPVNADRDLLVQLILGHQARILTERAQKAVQQIGNAYTAEDVLSVDPRTLEPPTTAYSSSSSSPSGRLNRSPPGLVGQSASTDIRSRVRDHMHLRKVCIILYYIISCSRHATKEGVCTILYNPLLTCN